MKIINANVINKFTKSTFIPGRPWSPLAPPEAGKPPFPKGDILIPLFSKEG